MAIGKAKITIQASVSEPPGTNAAFMQAGQSLTNSLGGSKVRSPSTTPAVTAHGFGTVTLVAGAATLDLTALTGINGAAVNGNGLKVVSVVFVNPSANPITVAKGGTNGYTGLGAAFSDTIPPGGTTGKDLASGGVTVSGTVKTLDITGTGTQTLNYDIQLG